MTETCTFETHIAAPAEAVLNWHLRAGAFERLLPPWDSTRVTRRSGSIEDNSMRVELSVPLAAGFRQRWKLHHENFAADSGFDDVLDSGAFPEWRHEHRIAAIDATSARLADSIHYSLPLGGVGRIGGGGMVRRRLERMFAYRHAVTRDDIAAHTRAALPPMRIAITGATGLVGRALAAYLATAGHTIVPISRRPLTHLAAGDPLAMAPTVVWDPAQGTIDADALEGVDAVIHLAGEPIAHDRWIPPARWTTESRMKIRESRIQGTRLIAETVARMEHPPQTLVCASAIGAYGDRADERLDDGSSFGNGFLADVVRDWESAAEPARAASIRVVHARFGIILSPASGALKRLLLPTKLGAGGALGSGKQWWSWIGLDDVLGAIEHSLATESIEGPVNVVSPHPERQKALARVLGSVLHRPAVIPAPAPILKLVLGAELASDLLLASAHVQPNTLLDTGYIFRHPTIEEALRHTLGKLQT